MKNIWKSFKKNRTTPRIPVYLDERLINKILKGDHWDFFVNRINAITKKPYYSNRDELLQGVKNEGDLFRVFILELSKVNSGVQSPESFRNAGFTESEINSIFGNYKVRFGLSVPQRFVKDKVFGFMCNRETAKLVFFDNNSKQALEIGKNMAYQIKNYDFIDWGRAIREFWKDESLKDYRSYIITN